MVKKTQYGLFFGSIFAFISVKVIFIQLPEATYSFFRIKYLLSEIIPHLLSRLVFLFCFVLLLSFFLSLILIFVAKPKCSHILIKADFVRYPYSSLKIFFTKKRTFDVVHDKTLKSKSQFGRRAAVHIAHRGKGKK